MLGSLTWKLSNTEHTKLQHVLSGSLIYIIITLKQNRLISILKQYVQTIFKCHMCTSSDFKQTPSQKVNAYWSLTN